MAAWDGASSQGKTQLDNFVPELWSDEIIASYMKNLVMAQLVKKMSMKGKKGDKINIPTPTRGNATAKSAGAAVTLIQATEGTTPVTIDQHWEYSRLIEDFAEVQALPSFRQFYTQDAGYALATRVDTTLIQRGRSTNGGAGTAAYANAYIGGDGTTAYNSGTPNATALTDAGIRRTIQRLDDADVPGDGRFFLIPPSSANTLRGLARFTEQAFVGSGDSIRTGEIGNLYGVPVFVSTNCDTATGAARICLLGHKDAIVLVEQMAPRVQTQYKQEYLATLMTADTIFGTAELRDGSLIPLAVPA